jgi:hypothetical protein
MNQLKTRFIIVVIFFLLTGCATVKDVQRATDLIRTDNELTRLLVEVRPSNQAGASTYLSGLAAHAKSEADNLKTNQNRWPDAIAYYRIAATAYWRSGKSEAVNDLFEVTNNGINLCFQLGKNAPDRDCLFLQLVIPFAGLESSAKDPDPSKLMEDVDFTDNSDTNKEIKVMATVRTSLIQTKPMVVKILEVGRDDILLTHPGMRQYYCDNAKKAFDYYDENASLFLTNVEEFHDNGSLSNHTPTLGVIPEKAEELRNLGIEFPPTCQ